MHSCIIFKSNLMARFWSLWRHWRKRMTAGGWQIVKPRKAPSPFVQTTGTEVIMTAFQWQLLLLGQLLVPFGEQPPMPAVCWGLAGSHVQDSFTKLSSHASHDISSPWMYHNNDLTRFLFRRISLINSASHFSALKFKQVTCPLGQKSTDLS